MSSQFKSSIGSRILLYLPLLLLFISVFNEFDFNYLSYEYFSFNFPFILIFYWSLKRIETLGYGYIFIAGMFNDAVIGFPIGVSSLTYLVICGFAAYLKNITLRPNLIKDWLNKNYRHCNNYHVLQNIYNNQHIIYHMYN